MYDNYEEKVIDNINYMKSLYDAQVLKLEREECIKILLFEDYVKQIKSNISRYDYLEDVFRSAQEELRKKLNKELSKKDYKNLKCIETNVMGDFLNNDKNFKLTGIVSGGYEGYYWSLEFEGYEKKFCIQIPVMKYITTKNIKYANHGKFVFSVEKSKSFWTTLKSSYKIKDIADFIKEYFNLEDK